MPIRNAMFSGIVEYYLRNRNSIKSIRGNNLSPIKYKLISKTQIKEKTTKQIIAQQLNTSVAFILNIAMLTIQKLTCT